MEREKLMPSEQRGLQERNKKGCKKEASDTKSSIRSRGLKG